ncbi:single-stranded-DNA-specific exonuclease RecJ [Baileyella intestinalis]|uniref:single-stranded-DNA-specific exonuclease RecJ n=1 Tax=Baileyella intestinalis TaxID=2606709 RepID=UPI0022E7CF05|nr:single-stranded-DNA-specific exonuclease RecJ [Baileyella intestinalis]
MKIFDNNTKNIPARILEIMKNRGITGPEEIREYISRKPQTAYDPFLMKGMDEAVSRIFQAVDNKEKIVVYGDYDTDGVTSTALLMRAIGTYTSNLFYYIPSRLDEGYGLHKESISRIKEEGADLLVSVDCGATAAEEVEFAHSISLDTVITDHHNVGEKKAPGIVVDPRDKDSGYPFTGLAGVGVAYKLALALSAERPLPPGMKLSLLELVAIGTIGDIMPLTDENRTIVKYGLNVINSGRGCLGIMRLIEMAGLDYKTITATGLAFGIIPRINSAGRLGDASVSVKMLLSENEDSAEVYCSRLMELNDRRRSLQDKAYEVCRPEAEHQLEDGDFLLIEARGVHEGILGIVAGKIKEEMHRPVVIVTPGGEDGLWKGTGRSVEGVNLFEMLNKYNQRFVHFGGHNAACGFTIEESEIAQLRKDLQRDMAQVCRENPAVFDEPVFVDEYIGIEEADLDLAEGLKLFEPCGKDNEMPVFGFSNVRIEDWRFLKNGRKYARFSVVAGRDRITGLLFHDAEDALSLAESGEPLDVYGKLEINNWRNISSVQMIVDGIRLSR